MGGVALLVSLQLQGQDPEELAGLKSLDSLYKTLYTFNYELPETSGSAYFEFPQTIQGLIDLAEEKGFYRLYFKCQNVLILYYRYSGEHYKVLEMIDATIARAIADGHTRYEAQFNYLKGTQYNRIDEFDSAIAYYDKAYDMAEKNKLFQIMSASVNAMAATYGKLRRYEDAMTYYRKALPLARQSPDSSMKVVVLGNIGLSHARLGDGDSALYYAVRTYEMAKRHQRPGEVWQAFQVFTMGSYLKGNYQRALDYSDSLMRLIEPAQDWGFMITPYLYRAKSWKALGNLAMARKDVERSVEIAREVGYSKGEMTSLEWLVAFEQEQGAFENGFKHLERLAHLKDSIKERETLRKLDQMAHRYELKVKDRDLKDLEKIKEANEAKIQFKNLLIALCVLIFVIIVFFTVTVYRRKIERQKMEAQESKNKLLLLQLNPHFLFNALSSIQLFLINKGQGKEALEYLSKFAKLMRRILENSRESYVSLENEVTTLRHYLDLQKVRFDHKFDYSIELDTTNDPADIMIPPMFAQPFIENSLEHGIAHKEDGIIRLWFGEQAGTLNFRVEDNGIGVTRSTKLAGNKKHQSLATIITQDRIALLRKQLKRRISFDVRDKRNEQEQVTGTEVIFELPIVYKFS